MEKAISFGKRRNIRRKHYLKLIERNCAKLFSFKKYDRAQSDEVYYLTILESILKEF